MIHSTVKFADTRHIKFAHTGNVKFADSGHTKFQTLGIQSSRHWTYEVPGVRQKGFRLDIQSSRHWTLDIQSSRHWTLNIESSRHWTYSVPDIRHKRFQTLDILWKNQSVTMNLMILRSDVVMKVQTSSERQLTSKSVFSLCLPHSLCLRIIAPIHWYNKCILSVLETLSADDPVCAAKI